MSLKSLKGNKTFLIVGLSVATVIPLLIITFIIGKIALWLWLGLFLGMLYMTWWEKRKKGKRQPTKRWLDGIDEMHAKKKETSNEGN